MGGSRGTGAEVVLRGEGGARGGRGPFICALAQHEVHAAAHQHLACMRLTLAVVLSLSDRTSPPSHSLSSSHSPVCRISARRALPQGPHQSVLCPPALQPAALVAEQDGTSTQPEGGGAVRGALSGQQDGMGTQPEGGGAARDDYEGGGAHKVVVGRKDRALHVQRGGGIMSPDYLNSMLVTSRFLSLPL